VKSIAVAVGIPDLHLFNKTIRAALGHSPRTLREKET
jgi:transcriptional regulator GlxA family with amidase domain